MTKEKIDALWNKAIRESIDDGSLYTRYRFAELVAAAEREVCAKVCEEKESYAMTIPCPDGIQGCCVMHTVPATRMRTANECAAAIRARGQE